MGGDSDRDSDVPPLESHREEGEQSEETWHVGISRRPTVIHPATRPKSKSGLLNDVQSAEFVFPEGDSPVDSEPEIHRATSVDLGRGHVRHVSAGSAKLLEIHPRSSMDSKPLSFGSTVVAEADPADSKL
jgi:hypothetical protein